MTNDVDEGSRSIEPDLQIASVNQSSENINATIWSFGGHIADEALRLENSAHEVSHLVTSESFNDDGTQSVCCELFEVLASLRQRLDSYCRIVSCGGHTVMCPSNSPPHDESRPSRTGFDAFACNGVARSEGLEPPTF